MIVFPNAKINIGLHVVSQRRDGYHNLETIFYPVQLTDALEMAETGITGIGFSGLQINGKPEENLVLKAYQLLKEEFGLPPLEFYLRKAIPAGAGLGGGSSDAAYTLKMINEYFNLQLSPEELKEYAAKLGADCPFFIENKPVFATGKGDQFKPVHVDLSGYQLVIIYPGVSVNTACAYEDIQPSKPSFSLFSLNQLPVEEWKGKVVNDFEKSIFKRFSEIKKWKDKLYDSGAVYASMTGSGAALYAIYSCLPLDFLKNIPRDNLLYCSLPRGKPDLFKWKFHEDNGG